MQGGRCTCRIRSTRWISDLGLAVSIAEEAGDLRADFIAHAWLCGAYLQKADRPQWDVHVQSASTLGERICRRAV